MIKVLRFSLAVLLVGAGALAVYVALSGTVPPPVGAASAAPKTILDRLDQYDRGTVRGIVLAVDGSLLIIIGLTMMMSSRRKTIDSLR